MKLVKNGEYIEIDDKYMEKLQKGKLIYEVIRVIDGVPLFFEDHMNRLKDSIYLLKEEYSFLEEDIKKMLLELINKIDIINGNIKIVLDYKNKDIYSFNISHSYPTQRQYLEGVRTIAFFGERNTPGAKVIDYNFRESVNKEIKEKGVYEAILVNNKGYITEGSKSNIFLVLEDTLYTAKVEGVLEGITRKKIISLCRENNIKIEEKDIEFKNIGTYEGLFISGTSPNILPISSVDSIPFKSSTNKLINTIKDIYNEAVTQYILNRK